MSLSNCQITEQTQLFLPPPAKASKKGQKARRSPEWFHSLQPPHELFQQLFQLDSHLSESVSYLVKSVFSKTFFFFILIQIPRSTAKKIERKNETFSDRKKNAHLYHESVIQITSSCPLYFFICSTNFFYHFIALECV